MKKKRSIGAKMLGSIILLFIILILGMPFILLGGFLHWYFFN